MSFPALFSLLSLSFSLVIFESHAKTASAPEEGLWEFSNLPKELIRSQYGFEADSAWWERLQKSAVRLTFTGQYGGGSGAFNSEDGLILTNHHVAAHFAGRAKDPKNPDRVLAIDGYYALSLEDELKVPGMEVIALQSIQNVTQRIQSAVSADADAGTALKERSAEISKIEAECSNGSDQRCDVVEMYKGAEFRLHHYKVYTDVRIRWMPEKGAAFFGGDFANFNFPRHALDASYVRVYEDGRPAHTPNFLKVDPQGPADQELLFVAGHPGSTSRIVTSDRLKFDRDVYVPYILELLANKEIALQQFQKRGPKEHRLADIPLMSVQNGRKAYLGRHEDGLLDPSFILKKEKAEMNLRASALQGASSSEEKANVGALLSGWDQIRSAYRSYETFFVSHRILASGDAFHSTLFGIARDIVAHVQSGKTAEDPILELKIYQDFPISLEMETATLTASLRFAVRQLGAEHEGIQKILGRVGVVDRAFTAINGTRLTEIAFRRELIEGGLDAVEASTDPMIQMALQASQVGQEYRKRYAEEVAGPEKEAYAKIAALNYATFGDSVYPDATFTLRLSYGTVDGWKQGVNTIAPMTTIGEAFELQASWENDYPWELPESWNVAQDQIDPNRPYNFVSTHDIHGGNSGSPVVNAAGDQVGLIFDGNLPSLPSTYQYEMERGRSVSVHTGAIVEALERVYHADALLEEIRGGKNPEVQKAGESTTDIEPNEAAVFETKDPEAEQD